MSPLELDLPSRNTYPTGRPAPARDARSIELESPRDRFLVHDFQVFDDARDGIVLRAKPEQLGVVATGSRAAHEYGLGEQALPPERGQSARVEVFRVRAPEAHAGVLDQ